jgi:enoyl-CoA hydratase/carnithine racemase
LRLGLANMVVPFDKLDATVDGAASRLASAPQVALAKIKAGLNHGAQNNLASTLEFEAVNQDACFHSADFMEGVTAFVQKRKAVFGRKA